MDPIEATEAAAAEIAAELVRLRDLALAVDLTFLAYLIDQARIEAESLPASEAPTPGLRNWGDFVKRQRRRPH